GSNLGVGGAGFFGGVGGLASAFFGSGFLASSFASASAVGSGGASAFFFLGSGSAGVGFSARGGAPPRFGFLFFPPLSPSSFPRFRVRILDRVRLCDLFDQGLCRLGFRRVLAAGRDLGEIGRGHEVDRQALGRRHRKRRRRERPHAPQQHRCVPDRRYGVGRP